MLETYFCLLCKTRVGFTTKVRLRKHCASVHRNNVRGNVIAGRPITMHAAKCYICRISFKFIRELRDHLESHHDYNPETVALEFPNFLAFEQWKNELESRTYARYRQQCGNKNGLTYYSCHCRAIGVQYSDRHCQFRIAFKTHDSCTSQIVVSGRNGIKVVFHGRHYGHAKVPIDKINEFCALNKLSSEESPSQTTMKPKRKMIGKDEDLESFTNLGITVIDLFQRKFKETTTDIENEIKQLTGKEITADMVGSLKNAWQLIKEAKIKLIEANSISDFKETSTYFSEESIENYSLDSPVYEEENIVAKRKVNIKNTKKNAKKVKKFDTISIVDGSIQLRCYDEKYKYDYDDLKIENCEEINISENDLSDFLSVTVKDDLNDQEINQYFDYQDLIDGIIKSEEISPDLDMDALL